MTETTITRCHSSQMQAVLATSLKSGQTAWNSLLMHPTDISKTTKLAINHFQQCRSWNGTQRGLVDSVFSRRCVLKISEVWHWDWIKQMLGNIIFHLLLFLVLYLCLIETLHPAPHYAAFIYSVDGSRAIQGLVQWGGIRGRGCWGRIGILTGSVWLWLCSKVVWRDGQREGEGRRGEGERHFLAKVGGLSRWGSLEMGPCWKDGKCPKPWFIAKASITLRVRMRVFTMTSSHQSPRLSWADRQGLRRSSVLISTARVMDRHGKGRGSSLNGRCHGGRCAHGKWMRGIFVQRQHERTVEPLQNTLATFSMFIL